MDDFNKEILQEMREQTRILKECASSLSRIESRMNSFNHSKIEESIREIAQDTNHFNCYGIKMKY